MTIKELKELIIKLEVVLNHNSVIKPCDYPKYEGLKIVKLRLFKGDTGVHVLIPEGYVGLVLPRSSYNCAGVATPTGVIDAGYTGSISVVLITKFDLKIFKGNRIAQLVIVPLPAVHLIEGDVTGVKSKRGLGGFGSLGA